MHELFSLSRPPVAPQSPAGEGINPLAPVLLIDPEGTVLHATPACRRLLEYRAGQGLDPVFFRHVHEQGRARVMRDVREMVLHGRRRVAWFLRLRTGHGQWGWYKATARNLLQGNAAAIVVTLTAFGR